MAEKKTEGQAAENRKAYHDYFVEEKYEAGIELTGTEIKSIRCGGVSLKDSYCSVVRGELWLMNAHISPYEKGNVFNKDPLRVRRLLMHKKEILKLMGLVERDGYSLIPLALYYKNGRIKVSVGLCRGKKLYDKRESLQKRDIKRETERFMKNRDSD